MRRRITVTIVAVVAGALLVAGLGTLLLTRRATVRDARHDLLLQAQAIAQAAEDARRPAAILALQRALKLENATVARLQPRTGTWVELPPGVTNADLRALGGAASIDGHHGTLVYAAATVSTGRARSAIVLTRHVASSGSGVGFFVVAASAALAIAALVGDRLGRRIAQPLRSAEATTRQIADGELDARVPQPARRDPELASLATSINAMAENLARLRGLERQFLLSVSHDLRTPLTSIRGFAEAIADGATDDDVRAAGVIAAEARRLERLVGDLLDLARLDAREFRFNLDTIDAGAVVVDTTDGFRTEAKDAGLALGVIVEGDERAPILVVADPERLAQVVANLVENALKFASSRIDVVVERGGNQVIVAVTDDGPGIPVEEQSRVFDRLYQPARSGGPPPRRVGSGLGLAIVAELVQAMQGSVRAVAAPDSGTRVIVTVPAATSSSSGG
jgi:two-component system sensor histidine kinase BaeS